MQKPKRVGFFAGTFDPVHNGHVAFATAALQHAALDMVAFMPEPSPRSKQAVSPLKHRVAMLRLVCTGNPKLQVLELQGQQFTVAQTLPQIRAAFAGAQLVMLVGSDVAKYLHTWPDIDSLLADVEVVAALRQGGTVPKGVKVIPSYYPHVAASQVRGGAFGDVPPQVADYIQRNVLY